MNHYYFSAFVKEFVPAQLALSSESQDLGPLFVIAHPVGVAVVQVRHHDIANGRIVAIPFIRDFLKGHIVYHVVVYHFDALFMIHETLLVNLLLSLLLQNLRLAFRCRWC